MGVGPRSCVLVLGKAARIRPELRRRLERAGHGITVLRRPLRPGGGEGGIDPLEALMLEVGMTGRREFVFVSDSEGPQRERVPPVLVLDAGLLERIDIAATGISLSEVETTLLRRALAKASDNQSQAARLLGISRQTLIYRMHKYGLCREEEE